MVHRHTIGKFFALAAAFALLVALFAQLGNVQSAENDTPLQKSFLSGSQFGYTTSYDFGEITPIFEDESGLEGHTGKTPATPGEQPWMAGLIISDYQNAHEGLLCGGALIAPQWVMTAAHCVDFLRPADLDVVLGRHTLSSNEGERIPTVAFYIHQGWFEEFNHDIALIQLQYPASVGQPLPLLTPDLAAYADTDVLSRVTGWGVLSGFAGTGPDELHGVDLPIVSEAACKAGYENDPVINYNQILCAGQRSGSISACFGDSGSSLTVAGPDGNRYSAGIVSFGAGCGWIGKYSVFTRVSSYTDWVASHLAGNPVNSRIIASLDAPPQNFLGFTLAELPFGYSFVDGYADDFELFLEYANADNDPFYLQAYNEGWSSMEEFLESVGYEPLEEEVFYVNGQLVLIFNFDGFSSAAFVQNGAIVFLDGYINIDQMQTMVKTVLDNS